ncbi:MAG: DUF5678 domain-containing protein [Candidatus Thermoplasmatota archaeon]|nr:DUF5678 domain-containing protein [Candidatus Thermoplasmatota archaeon]
MIVKVHDEKLSSGEWVLIFNDEIIDHSANIEDMLRLAEEKYSTDKYPQDLVKISKILSKTNPREVLLDRYEHI